MYAEIKKLIPDIKQTTSVTTREQRPNETEGVDYYYVTEEEFKDMIAKDVFVEYIFYDNHLYGTLKKELKGALESNGIYVLVIDVKGAIKIKELFPQTTTIFILPPSLEELKRRLIERGYNVLSDIEFSPDSINCQATAAAQYVGLQSVNKLNEALSSFETYIEICAGKNDLI